MDDEARRRTAIGRAYYASFLLARDMLHLTLGTPQVHQKVVEALHQTSHATANKMHTLRRMRNQSDYNTNINIHHDDVDEALELAKTIIESVTPSPGQET